MKHSRRKKLLALLLAFSMVLSMVGSAFAVQPERMDSETEPFQEEDVLGFEGDAEMTEGLEEPVVDQPAEEWEPFVEEAPVEEPSEEPIQEPSEAPMEGEWQEPVQEEPSEEPVEGEWQEPVDEFVEEETPVEEPLTEESAESEEAEQAEEAVEGENTTEEIQVEAGNLVDLRWEIADGVFSLFVNGAPAEGYYNLPEMWVDQVRFLAGVYYFQNGQWDSANNGKMARNSSATVNLVTLNNQNTYQMQQSGQALRLTLEQPQIVEQDGVMIVDPNSELYVGLENSICYFNGQIYNGFLRVEGNPYLWFSDANGHATYFTGRMNDPAYAAYPYIDNYVAMDKNVIYDKLEKAMPIGEVFFVGGWHNGYYSDSQKGRVYKVSKGVKSSKAFSGIMSTKWWYAIGMGTTQRQTGTGLRYVDGKLFNGYLYKSNKILYQIKNGKSTGAFTGKLGSKQEVWDASGEKEDYHSLSYKGRIFKNGVLFTGVDTDRYYYKNGKKQTVENKKWINVKSGNIYLTYYFAKDKKDGKVKAVTGWHYITRGGVKYKYYFRNTDEKNPCSAVTDMFSYNSAYKTKKLQIHVNRSIDMVTILAYDADTKSYCIPCKSFVVAMSKAIEDTHSGTYNLKKKSGWHKFMFENGSYHYYLYPTHIWGSNALFHSVDYAKEGDRESMMNYIYNQLGRNVTHYCVRAQAVNSKLIYNLVRANENIKVILTSSSSVTKYQPFGKMTLSYNFDYVGKLYAPDHSTRGFDPTDTAIKGKTPKMQ
ncbi:MAG: hypothetical protein MJ077_00120 [Oscillospiraceae bacterium]|nr:hypothetical protein [Oscillospiraceae bacterium]